MNKKKIANLAPYGYITPITVILVGFVIVSVIISIVLSFTRYNIMTPPTFYGLKNYERLVTDTKFMKALFNTLKLMVMIVPLQMILSLIVSVFLVSHRHMLIGKIANSVIFIPVLCSNAATGVIWRELLNGKIPAVETFFGLFGIKASMLLGNAKTALAVVAAVAIWKMLGYSVVIYSSGLLGISESFYEAAKVDGANAFQTFTKITLPYMLYVTTPYLIVTFTGNVNNFNVIYLLSGGDPVTNLSSTAGKTDLLVTWLYKLTIDKQYYNIGAVIGIMTFIILAIGCLLTYRNSKSYKEEGGF